VSIPTGKNVDGTVYYIINVTGSFSSWSVQKRYSQFEEMHTAITTEHNKTLPAGADLPPKRFKIFTSHLSPAFIEERRVLLESSLKKLLGVQEIAKSAAFIRFLTCDKCQTEEKRETKSLEELLPDDVEITSISIPATRTMSDHVLYQIDVTNARKRKTYSKWAVLKRFGQFYEMDTAMRADFVGQQAVLDSLPPPPQRKAKLFNDHMDENFVEQRRVLLEHYLTKLLHCPDVVRNKSFLTFLGVR